MMVNIGNEWDELLKNEWEKPYYRQLREFLKREYNTFTIYPAMHDIFNSLRFTPYEKVKAVILGQDPYHEPNQAHGLCFSVKKGEQPPPSLLNIYSELQDDCGIAPVNHGELTEWAQQGVLLLNTVLTVRRGAANSHKGQGWELLTDRIIALLDEREKPLVFMLWGANAKAKINLLHNRNHLVLTAAHPSPLSANRGGWFGCRHFSKANTFLRERGLEEIDWRLT